MADVESSHKQLRWQYISFIVRDGLFPAQLNAEVPRYALCELLYPLLQLGLGQRRNFKVQLYH